ncbi:MAG: hypothetical protein FJ098_08610 [Deltaproteobacteria bacterium]|nr:hypothetical protein [Deltaproteobacteria bacterium]
MERRAWRGLAALLLVGITGCSPASTPGQTPDIPDDALLDASPADGDRGAGPDTSPPPPRLRVITFNTGTSLKPPDGEENRGYGPEQWAACDTWYGNGLSWIPLVEDAAAWMDGAEPDIVAFQEIFWPGDCPGIPEEHHPGFVCEGWAPGDLTVAERVLGEEWQVACHPGKPDKCLGVNRRAGSLRGCAEDFCLEGLEGFPVEDCGKGARIARGVVDLTGSGVLTVVSVHGSSGFSVEDGDCRARQFEQIFVDLGDGEPAANGEWNLILGDFNVDPVIMAGLDAGADVLNAHVGAGLPFGYVTEEGPSAPATYAGYVRIDHVISDVFGGACWHSGISAGHDPVTPATAFDHHPAVCDLVPR